MNVVENAKHFLAADRGRIDRPAGGENRTSVKKSTAELGDLTRVVTRTDDGGDVRPTV